MEKGSNSLTRHSKSKRVSCIWFFNSFPSILLYIANSPGKLTILSYLNALFTFFCGFSHLYDICIKCPLTPPYKSKLHPIMPKSHPFYKSSTQIKIRALRNLEAEKQKINAYWNAAYSLRPGSNNRGLPPPCASVASPGRPFNFGATITLHQFIH